MNRPIAEPVSAQLYTRENLLQRARQMAKILRERAIESYENRRVCEQTIDDFWTLDLFNLLKPHKHNGPQIRPDWVFEIAGILAEGDGSGAWVWNLLTLHDHFVALLPEQAQHEYWSTPRALGASSFAANGSARPAPGGYILSGKWSFCSGVDCADWMLLGAKCEEPAEIRWVLVPKSDWKIIDDWHVLGLCGTGSKSVVVEDKFVPEHRTVRYHDLLAGTTPGSKIHQTPLHKTPVWTIFTLGICAPATGIARGAAHSFIEEMKTRVYGVDYSHQSKNPAIQMRIAEATAMIDAADILYKRAAAQITELILAGESPSLEERIRSRRDQAYAVKTARQATELLLEAQGGKGLYNTNHVQRAARDLQALSAHLMATWDMPAQTYGRVILGNAPDNPYY
jgi:alkylation response protein AidB-like acyl-CoA dehydrogenase